MTREEELIEPLAEACGLELKPDADGLYDLAVGDVSVVLRYEQAGDAWLMMAPVTLSASVAPTADLLRRALEMNLLGTRTNGCNLGLLGDQFILSRRVGAQDLTAEAFADELHILERTVEQVAAGLVTDTPSAETATIHSMEERFYA